MCEFLSLSTFSLIHLVHWTKNPCPESEWARMRLFMNAICLTVKEKSYLTHTANWYPCLECWSVCIEMHNDRHKIIFELIKLAINNFNNETKSPRNTAIIHTFLNEIVKTDKFRISLSRFSYYELIIKNRTFTLHQCEDSLCEHRRRILLSFIACFKLEYHI